MEKIAIIFAGGTGQRMGSEVPKQFLKVHDKEIIVHTLELFEKNEEIDHIYVACVEEGIDHLNSLVTKYNLEKVVRVFPGGATGQDSIFIALCEAKKDYDNAIVLIHDGVRPLVSHETISNCIKSVEEYGSGITVTPCFETPITSMDGEVVTSMPPRSVMYTAQAPQAFLLNDIYNAHLKERKDNPNYVGIVDSCGLMFKQGIRCHLVEGNRGNIKVTTPEDYSILLGNYVTEDYKRLLDLQDKQKDLKIKKMGDK